MIDIEAWLICDNDGGRLEEPVPLLRHVRGSKAEAESLRRYLFSPAIRVYYPIKKIRIVEALDQ